MSTMFMFSSKKWRFIAIALQPQQLSSSMVTPGAKRGREEQGQQQLLIGARRKKTTKRKQKQIQIVCTSERTIIVDTNISNVDKSSITNKMKSK